MADVNVPAPKPKRKNRILDPRFPLTCSICGVAKCEGRRIRCEPCYAAWKVDYMARYQVENADQIAVRLKVHRQELGEAYRAPDRARCNARYHADPTPGIADSKMRYQADPEAWRARTAKNVRKRKGRDPEGERAKVAKRMRLRRQNSICVTVSGRMSNRIWTALKRKAGKKKPWLKSVDYTVDQLIARLHETMPTGFGWDDFMTGALHIDHIRPVASFTFASEEDEGFRACWALSNLQLLPALENIQKGARLDWQAAA